MNIDQAKVYLADLKAKTQVVEWFIEDGTIDLFIGKGWITDTNPALDCDPQCYRRTPKPTYVPFTLDTFPKCPVWIRAKGGVRTLFVGDIGMNGLKAGPEVWTWQGACDYAEISLDHRATWQPCGQAVKSPQTKDL